MLVPLLAWLLLNEFVYTTTSQVLGREAILLIWSTPGAVFENAWEMGAAYLVTTAVLAIAAAAVIYRLSVRSFRCLGAGRQMEAESRGSDQAPHGQPAETSAHGLRSARWAGSVSAGLVILAGLLAWQFCSRPSEALTVLFRSAPPLRAFNLTRALIGIELTGPVPEHFAEPIISQATYQANMGRPRTPAPNVILVLLESVPARVLHCYGHPRSDVTPNFDALAREGILFEHCLASASFSTYSVVSLMTSLYMLRSDYNDHLADTSFPFLSLPKALKLAGYELALFSSGNEAFDNINLFYPPADFDTYFSHDTCDIKKADCMRMDDRHAVGEFETWLSRRTAGRPFYCGFYLQSTHFNYEVPEPWFSHYQPVPPLYSNGDGIIHIPSDLVPLLKNQYDNAMRYSDHWMGRIRAALDRAGELDNSIIVITGDHGEAFMEHGLARHGVHVWEEMIHVPLIVYVGQQVREPLAASPGARISGTVSHIDVAPTIAGLVGIERHPSWQGMDVLAPGYTSRDRPIFSVLQLTRWMEVVCLNKLKYVYDLTDIQSHLFDLNTDPHEQEDLVPEKPELASAMQAILGAWHTRQLTYYAPSKRPFTHFIGRYEPDTEVLERIRNMTDGR